MKSIAAIAILGLALSGCGYKEVNQMIADSNVQRLQAYADGMKACGVNAACQVGLSMAFAGNMGQQDLIRPESAKDYIVTITPLVSILSQWAGGGNGANGGVSISDSDGASVFFLRDTTVAAESQVYSQTTPTISKTYNTQTNSDESANEGDYTYSPTDTK
jgi:hypothetical protein